ncbi:MAG: nitrite/sulfite reductase [Rhodospirillales bacterium]|nr:nitrite/sulfite reductase [Rhodospirillales bacterium]MBO6788795.1 nitrite/sulfite reductase [Rhodospirillales bacterium]
MYKYDDFDHAFVSERVGQFREQVSRRLSGDLSEDEFRPLRLMNGLYLQLHAYMLRVAIPYGLLSSTQMRKLAEIARTYDRGYGHFTTRQNIQFNWPKLEDTPDILEELASVEMHAIQTSGNCIRNVTADQYAGVDPEEIDDSRVWSELIRQWSSLHPEFSFLPRKFKIAVTGSPHDRTAVKFHDIGLILKRSDDGEVGFEVLVGGGLGRTPMIGRTIREFLPKDYLLSYLEAILRVYNMLGRRDNKYKARIKILVHETGIDELREMVEAEWENMKEEGIDLPHAELDRVRGFFTDPDYEDLPDNDQFLQVKQFENPTFGRWVRANVAPHKKSGYVVANISLKPVGGAPGDLTAAQMDAVAELADKYSFGELRVAHEQNLVFADVKKADLFALWKELDDIQLGTPNLGLISDIIACPGLDYCSLANARSIPVAQRIQRRFADIKRQFDIGALTLNISGCINACGHHHAGHIGILGVDRKGEEYYQLTLGGSADENASIGKIVGPAFSSEQIVDAVETVVETYLKVRKDGEPFLATYRRLGEAPFKSALFGEKQHAAA